MSQIFCIPIWYLKLEECGVRTNICGGWAANSPPFMEPEVLLPRSQAAVTISCSEPDESRLSRHILFLQDFHYYSIYVCISYVIVSLQCSEKVTENFTIQWAKPLLPIKEVPGLNCQPETDYLDRKFRGDRIQSNLLGQTAALTVCSYSLCKVWWYMSWSSRGDRIQ
jgi:hypothetical protein